MIILATLHYLVRERGREGLLVMYVNISVLLCSERRRRRGGGGGERKRRVLCHH